MNVKFSYLYRDGGNYKQYKEIIFSNPTQLELQKIEQTIKSYLIEETWFVAKNWNVPDMHFKEYAWDAEIDHYWHEFDCIEQTKESATEEISIEAFLDQISRIKSPAFPNT